MPANVEVSEMVWLNPCGPAIRTPAVAPAGLPETETVSGAVGMAYATAAPTGGADLLITAGCESATGE